MRGSEENTADHTHIETQRKSDLGNVEEFASVFLRELTRLSDESRATQQIKAGSLTTAVTENGPVENEVAVAPTVGEVDISPVEPIATIEDLDRQFAETLDELERLLSLAVPNADLMTAEPETFLPGQAESHDVPEAEPDSKLATLIPRPDESISWSSVPRVESMTPKSQKSVPSAADKLKTSAPLTAAYIDLERSGKAGFAFKLPPALKTRLAFALAGVVLLAIVGAVAYRAPKRNIPAPLPPAVTAVKQEEIPVEKLLEAAFALAARIPRDSDECEIQLDGSPEITLPSRVNDRMYLYSGDKVRVTIISGDDAASAQPATLSLKVGERSYPLQDVVKPGRNEKTVSIEGNSPAPMAAALENPMRIRGVTVRISANSAELTQGQTDFRRLILGGNVPETSRQVYKETTADILNVRRSPGLNAQLLSKLTTRSFVRVLQDRDEWSEVKFPDGRQGWVAKRYLREIR